MGEFAGAHTEHAQRGVALKLVFEAVLSKHVPGYRAELTSPEESTGGGVRALQRIRLVPKSDAPDLPTVVAGEANVDKGIAELRTLGHVQAIHQHRFGRPFPIPKDEYLAFVENAEKVLKEFGLRVTLNATPDVPKAPPPRKVKAPSSRVWPWLLAGVMVAAAAIVVWSSLE